MDVVIATCPCSYATVVARIYPEKPLFLGDPDDRAMILSWFNSFRAHQYDFLKNRWSRWGPTINSMRSDTYWDVSQQGIRSIGRFENQDVNSGYKVDAHKEIIKRATVDLTEYNV